MRLAASLAEFEPLRSELVGTVALVPTMGALHEGHRSLIRLARRHADQVLVSIFVNPLQFGPTEDYARYPRPLAADLEVCEADGVDLVLAPTVADLYPAGRQVSVSAGALGTVLEGGFRPGHFDGVLTIVLKLFNVVRPDVAVFGRKDAQQVVCIRRMAVDLNLGVRVLDAPIVRDDDGLALSSRNAYLSVPDRQAALALVGGLQSAARQPTPGAALAAAYDVIGPASAVPGFDLDYLKLVHPDTLAEVASDHVGDALLLVAARVGSTRLIDNVDVCFPG